MMDCLFYRSRLLWEDKNMEVEITNEKEAVRQAEALVLQAEQAQRTAKKAEDDARARIAGRPRKAATSHAKHYIRSPHAVFAANLKLGIRDYERITYGLESDVPTVNLQTVAWRWNAQRLRGYLPK
jgi:hypothetical protein